MKGKFVVAREGGGSKTEVRTGKHEGWLVLEFEYDDDGKRKRVDAKQSAADGYVISILRQDPDFWEKFLRLAGHPQVQAALPQVGA